MKSFSPPSWESFNFDFSGVESAVSERDDSYRGLDPRALCSDPADVLSIISDPLIQGSWVDLGSGFGHTVLTYSMIYPQRNALGLEFELPRVCAARKEAWEKKLSNAEFYHADLLTAPIPKGDNYFLYFPQGHVLDRVLFELSKCQADFNLVAIESHGDLFSRLDREAWLDVKKEIILSGKRHSPFARIYRTNTEKRNLAGLHPYSFLQRYFLIRDGLTEWWGNSFGLYASGDKYFLPTPSRTVHEDQVVKIVTIDEVDQETELLLTLREFPGVSLGACGNVYHGPIRKIIKSPAFSVEFPGGERVEWKDIVWIKQENNLCYDSSRGFFFSPRVP